MDDNDNRTALGNLKGFYIDSLLLLLTYTQKFQL